MEQLVRDLRISVRSLFKSPGFTLAAVLCLAVGIGANTAVFSVINAVLLRTLPISEPDRVVVLWGELQGRNMTKIAASGLEYFDYRDQISSFEQIGGFIPAPRTLTGVGDPVQLKGVRATWTLLPLLGIQPLEGGRLFNAEEDVFGNEFVTLLSHQTWRQRFNADPNIVGRSIILNDKPHEVLGVLPEDFDLLNKAFDLWVPLASNLERLPPRAARGLTVIGRLADGVSLDEAQAEVTVLAKRFEEGYPDLYRPDDRWRLGVVPIFEEVIGDFRSKAAMLMGAVALVLIIACANVANLLLARATSRGKEVAVRTALGASRSALIRQLLTESVLIGLAGGIVGLLLAVWGTKALIALNPPGIPRLGEVDMDGTVLLFTLGVSVLTGLLFGLVPALQATKPDLQSTLKEGGKTSAAASAGNRSRAILVIAEVAIAVIVLFGAGLLWRSYSNIQDIETGFDSENALALEFFLSPVKYTGPAQVIDFIEELQRRLEEIPGVQAAAIVDKVHMSPRPPSLMRTQLDGGGLDPEQAQVPGDLRLVKPGYFDAMGIRVLEGRDFNRFDTVNAPPVAIIDQELAQRFWPGESAIGKRLKIPVMPWAEIVGVVNFTRTTGLVDLERNQVYVPYHVAPSIVATAVLRTQGDPLQIAGATRQALWAIDRDVPVVRLETLEALVNNSVADRRAYTVLLGLAAFIALLLVMLGVYGVMSYAVAQRVQEIGIRMALGAGRGEVLGLTLKSGMKLAIIGLAVGLVLAILAGQALGKVSQLLHEVSGLDPMTLTGVSLLLLGLASVATLIPAHRATRISPVTALKYE